MRLPLLKCADLDDVQKPLYADMKAGIEQSFKGFTAIDRDGDLIGPWNPWLTFPQFGGPVWNLVKGLATKPQREATKPRRANIKLRRKIAGWNPGYLSIQLRANPR